MLQRLCAATMRRTVAGRSRVALNAIALQDGIVYDYAYDGAERLKDVTVTGAGPASETFTYDLAGNRTTWSGAPGAAASYDLDDEIEGAGEAPYAAYEGDTVYVHDDNGNVTAKTTQNEAWEYVYDVKNRLVEVKLDGASVATYGYDPFNRRLWKETGGQKTWYLYAKEGLIGEYLVDSGTPPVELKTYGYLPGSSWTTNPLFQKVGEEYFWYLNDHLGTPRMMVDTNGETVWSADYEAYGKATVATGTIANNIRFPGQYYDAESGLHWNFNRYYDPGTGRYVGVDPIGLAGGLNLYGYVRNNPVNLIDPTGLDWQYSQSTGQLTHIDANRNSTNVGSGYAGHGQGVNNPAMQNVPRVGPIPQGTYTINPQQNNTTGSGTRLPASMRLTPDPNNQMFGRGGFLIHGDNAAGNQSASEGCPVLNRNIRNQIGNSGDNVLRVVP